MAHVLPLRVDHRAWIDRCYLPLVVGIAVAVSLPMADGDDTRIALAGGEQVVVARDLGTAAMREIQRGELLCMRLNDGVAVTVDFVDGRPPLVSAQLPRVARS